MLGGNRFATKSSGGATGGAGGASGGGASTLNRKPFSLPPELLP